MGVMGKALLLPALLVVLGGCWVWAGGPGEGPSILTDWDVNKGALEATRDGVTLSIVGVGPQQDMRFEAMKTSHTSHLVMNYALFESDRETTGALLPGAMVVTDETGAVCLEGQVTHFTIVDGVSLGFARFDGGPGDVADALTLTMNGVRQVAFAPTGPSGDAQTSAEGKWVLQDFLTLRHRPHESLRLPGFSVNGLSGKMGGIEVSTLVDYRSFGEDVEPGVAEPLLYYAWRITTADGEERMLFWAEQVNGEPRLITLTEWLSLHR